MTPLDESVRTALAIANDRRPDAAPGAGALLAALERVDRSLGWERVVLHLGDVRALADEREIAPVLVEGHVVSGACGRAVDRARTLASDLGNESVSPPLLAVTLLAELRLPAEVDREEIHGIVCNDLLGAELAFEQFGSAGGARADEMAGAHGPYRTHSCGALEPDLLAASARRSAPFPPGLCDLLASAVAADDRLQVAANWLNVDLEERDSPLLEGIDEEDASDLFTGVQTSDRTPGNVVTALLRRPSWKLHELLAIQGVDGDDLLVAFGLAMEESSPLPRLLADSYWRLARWIMRLWLAYMIIRYGSWSAAVAYVPFAVWRPTLPQVPFLAAALALLAAASWLPGLLFGSVVLFDAVAMRIERRALGEWAGKPIRRRCHRKVVRLATGEVLGLVERGLMEVARRRQDQVA